MKTLLLFLVLLAPMVTAAERPTLIYTNLPEESGPFDYLVRLHNPQPYRAKFVITQPEGDFWTPETFPKEIILDQAGERAQEYDLRFRLIPQDNPFVLNTTVYSLSKSNPELLHTSTITIGLVNGSLEYIQPPSQIAAKPYGWDYLDDPLFYAILFFLSILISLVFFRRMRVRRYRR